METSKIFINSKGCNFPGARHQGEFARSPWAPGLGPGWSGWSASRWCRLAGLAGLVGLAGLAGWSGSSGGLVWLVGPAGPVGAAGLVVLAWQHWLVTNYDRRYFSYIACDHVQ